MDGIILAELLKIKQLLEMIEKNQQLIAEIEKIQKEVNGDEHRQEWRADLPCGDRKYHKPAHTVDELKGGHYGASYDGQTQDRQEDFHQHREED